MARPPKFKCTPEEIRKIEVMASYGLNMKQIASIMGLNKRTIERHMNQSEDLAKALEGGRAKAIYNVSKTAYDVAVSGRVPAMTMFWLKCQAGWRDVVKVEANHQVTLESLVAPTIDVVEASKQLSAADDDEDE